MRLTLRHYYDFGAESARIGTSLLSPDAWERLRLGVDDAEARRHFGLTTNRSEWLEDCKKSTMARRAADDLTRLAQRFSCLVSIGVGRGYFEYHLKNRMPDVRIICTEYSAGVVDRLRTVFSEADAVVQFDLLDFNWEFPTTDTLCILNRVDTELSDDQWTTAFEGLHRSNVSNIVMVASGFVTPKSFLREVSLRVSALALRCRLTFSGYHRSRERFRELWVPSYALESTTSVAGLAAFLLRRAEGTSSRTRESL